jgi:hypothetical protein
MSSERVLCDLGETRDYHDLLSAKASEGVVKAVKANHVSVENTEKNRDMYVKLCSSPIANYGSCEPQSLCSLDGVNRLRQASKDTQACSS